MRLLKVISFFFLSLGMANAYVAPSQANGEESSSQIAAVILLNEDGRPRCQIRNSEYLSSERFEDFVLNDPETEQAIDELNSLRTCDDGDELYARFVLDPQEISIAGVPQGGMTNGALIVLVTAANAFISCGISFVDGQEQGARMALIPGAIFTAVSLLAQFSGARLVGMAGSYAFFSIVSSFFQFPASVYSYVACKPISKKLGEWDYSNQ